MGPGALRQTQKLNARSPFTENIPVVAIDRDAYLNALKIPGFKKAAENFIKNGGRILNIESLNERSEDLKNEARKEVRKGENPSSTSPSQINRPDFMKSKALIFLILLVTILSIFYFVYQKKTEKDNFLIEFFFLPESTVDSIIMQYNGRGKDISSCILKHGTVYKLPEIIYQNFFVNNQKINTLVLSVILENNLPDTFINEDA